MSTFTVFETKNIRRRANGAVAFFKGKVEFGGRTIHDFRIQLKATDEGADEVRLDGSVLTMPEAV